MEKEKSGVQEKKWALKTDSVGSSRLINLTKSVKYVEYNEKGQCVKIIGFCKARDFRKRCENA